MLILSIRTGSTSPRRPQTMPRRDDDETSTLRTAEFLVLAALASGPLHGYGVAQDVVARTGGRVRLRPGNLYRVIDRMLDRGLVEVADRRPARIFDDERRTYYRLTAKGRRAAAAEAALLAEVAAQVKQLLLPGKA